MNDDRALQIDLNQLRAAFELLMTYLAEESGQVIATRNVHFWAVAPTELYDVYTPLSPGMAGRHPSRAGNRRERSRIEE